MISETRLNPSRAFSREELVYCYFELYNLKLAEIGLGRCSVEYIIQEHQSGENISSLINSFNPFSRSKETQSTVSVLNEFENININEPIILAFDVSNLRSGIYQFLVNVTDLNLNQRVHSKKLFQLME